jgi:hypothetical protein
MAAAPLPILRAPAPVPPEAALDQYEGGRVCLLGLSVHRTWGASSNAAKIYSSALNEPATRESRKAVTTVCQWVTGAKRTGETSGTFGLWSHRSRRSRKIAPRSLLPSHDHGLCCPVSRAWLSNFYPRRRGPSCGGDNSKWWHDSCCLR